jgi:hypothetical protein
MECDTYERCAMVFTMAGHDGGHMILAGYLTVAAMRTDTGCSYGRPCDRGWIECGLAGRGLALPVHARTTGRNVGCRSTCGPPPQTVHRSLRINKPQLSNHATYTNLPWSFQLSSASSTKPLVYQGQENHLLPSIPTNATEVSSPTQQPQVLSSIPRRNARKMSGLRIISTEDHNGVPYDTLNTSSDEAQSWLANFLTNVSIPPPLRTTPY